MTAVVTGCSQRPAKTTANDGIFGRNLITNGGAESDQAGWSNGDELKTIVYGDYGGGPARDSPGPANRGEKYFYARTTTDAPMAAFSQKINVGTHAEPIDGGAVTCNFGGWFGIANGSMSAGRLVVTFLDKAGKELSTLATKEITDETRPPDETLIERNASGPVPAGTREIKIVLEFKLFPNRPEQQDGLAFADDLAMVLTTKAPQK